MTEIYQKLLELAEKGWAADVFATERELGEEEIRKVLKKKEATKKQAALLPRAEEYAYAGIKSAVSRMVEEVTGAKPALTLPPGEVAADLAIPCFEIAKAGKKPPKEAAQKLADKLMSLSLPFSPEISAAGGYVNLRFDKSLMGGAVINEIFLHGERYGASAAGGGETVIVEYSSPNVAKPMSVGHLRSTIIGESLKRIYQFGGYAVVGINHLGDFGTQFGKLLYAWRAWRDEAAFKKDPIAELLRLYVKFHEEAKENLALDEEARKLFLRLEKGDAELMKTWLEFCAISLGDFRRIYDALGVEIDLTLGESFYETMLEPAMKELFDKKIATQNPDGSMAVNFIDEAFPSFLLKKKDGSSLYILRDIATALFRLKAFAPAKIIYTVGSEQTLHFQQLFKTLGLLGCDPAVFEHAAFGLVSLPEGKISTRAGRVVFLEDLLKEAKARSLEIIREKEPDLPADEQEARAEKIGTAAIIYNDLSQQKEKNIVFRWEDALSMEGDSAPYLLYVYARARSILVKAGECLESRSLNIVVTTEREEKLITRLARFPEIVGEARSASAPHGIVAYLNTLAQAFNKFYSEDPVLKAEEKTRASRLALVKAVAQTIKNGLWLLGIETLERI